MPLQSAKIPQTSTRRVRLIYGKPKARGQVGIIITLAILLAVGVAFFVVWKRSTPAKDAAAGAGYQSVIAPAQKYANALQTGQYQQALIHVAWIEDRLERVRAEKGTPDAESAALADLVKDVTATDRSHAVISDEGIEDQYIFVPRATIEAAGADAGRSGLERKTAGRAWLRVTYPDPAIAPRDTTGRPIKSLTVGLNLSDDLYVLKAEIVGNLEIDRFSIRYF